MDKVVYIDVIYCNAWTSVVDRKCQLFISL